MHNQVKTDAQLLRPVDGSLQLYLSTASLGASKSLITLRPKEVYWLCAGCSTNSKHAKPVVSEWLSAQNVAPVITIRLHLWARVGCTSTGAMQPRLPLVSGCFHTLNIARVTGKRPTSRASRSAVSLLATKTTLTLQGPSTLIGPHAKQHAAYTVAPSAPPMGMQQK